MILNIPIFVQERRPKGALEVEYVARPLFFAQPQRRGAQTSRVVNLLAQDIRVCLDKLANEPRQLSLARWTFNPPLREHHAHLDLALRRQTVRCSLLVVAFDAMDRTLAFSPQLPEVWFDVPRGQDITSRANAVYREYFLHEEREHDRVELPADVENCVRGWVSSIELDVRPNPIVPRDADVARVSLGEGAVASGRLELRRVGHCLDWLYPDELHRAVLREAEVEELKSCLARTDRRPVLLLGPRRAGKTAVIHECVFRRAAERDSHYIASKNVWLLAPQRLISGMSYLGQWQNRLLAILDEAKTEDHVLYFDDVLGLYQAGISAHNDLTVAHMMRPFVERRDFRMLAEMTSEAFAVLQELDRPFADLFHVIHIRELPLPQARRVLVAAMRRLEQQHQCVFDVDALPALLDLQQRYVRDMALPGKATAALRDMAIKHRRREIKRDDVIAEFSARSGLAVSFLDGNVKLRRQQVVDELKRRIVSQDAAVEAMADTVCVAKARLNDPGRPLATMLFLGPTGVGKTQCAKELARYLFGSEDRLLRFDMNEFIDPYSQQRLIGTFHEPEGLLTAAVRRRPFCVILLDEIEKASAGVFDLLLQALGEGRLTDARGRTVDLSNAIVIMTSNLGVRDAAAPFGLHQREDPDRQDKVYLDAAQRFFRPEFFNRLDRVIPFRQLTREQIANIAGHLIADVFQREGLVHRRCVLQVDPAAREQVINAGYDPHLGARALKRAIERQVAQPVAVRLAEMPPGAAAVISLFGASSSLAVQIDPLEHVAAAPQPVRAALLCAVLPGEALYKAEDALLRIEEQIAALEPAGHLRQGALSERNFRYLTVQELARRARGEFEKLESKVSSRKPHSTLGRGQIRPPARKEQMWIGADGGRDWRNLLSATDLRGHLAELAADPPPPADELRTRLLHFAQETALLDAMVAAAARDGPDRALLLLRPIGHAPAAAWRRLHETYLAAFASQYGVSASSVAGPHETYMEDGPLAAAVIEFPGAPAILACEHGSHLFLLPHGGVELAQVCVLPLAAADDAGAACAGRLQLRRQWRAELSAGRAAVHADPFKVGPAVRVYDESSVTTDLRTTLTMSGLPGAAELRRFILAHLPYPEEFNALL